ncbi:DNA-processing protein DprA [Micromonospora sp. CPCC 205371]|nr:DNA-processing protein DprA [Micromonospora sp. CPCC 205371]
MTRLADAHRPLRIARVALHWLVEPGNAAVHRMVRRHGPVRTLDKLLDGDVPDQELRGSVSARLKAGDPYEAAAVAIARADDLGARIVTPEDDEWPRQVDDLKHLLEIPSDNRIDRDTAPPLCLWVRGPLPLAETLDRSVAVVGARAATAYGEHVATSLAFGLAERGWTVVSGGAYGIDSSAHRGALTAGGATVAVLACGVDRPYPMGNTSLFDRIAETGLMVSEWLPGADPVRHRFLIRNRVIAAATRGTVVVEAAARSGASQTLRRAHALGRRPMVVPGPVTSAMSVGCHHLLREHPQIRLVTGLPHVLEEVGSIGNDLAPTPRGPDRPHDVLDSEAMVVFDAMPRRRPAGPDALAARAGLDVRTVMRKLSLLEQLGFVVRREGGYMLAPKVRDGGAPTENEGGARPDRESGAPTEREGGAAKERESGAPA